MICFFEGCWGLPEAEWQSHKIRSQWRDSEGVSWVTLWSVRSPEALPSCKQSLPVSSCRVPRGGELEHAVHLQCLLCFWKHLRAAQDRFSQWCLTWLSCRVPASYSVYCKLAHGPVFGSPEIRGRWMERNVGKAESRLPVSPSWSGANWGSNWTLGCLGPCSLWPRAEAQWCLGTMWPIQPPPDLQQGLKNYFPRRRYSSFFKFPFSLQIFFSFKNFNYLLIIHCWSLLMHTLKY